MFSDGDSSNETRRPRILFVAEAVTLAHVARPAALLTALDPAKFELHLACAPRYDHLLSDLPATRHQVGSISAQQFGEALASGTPVYDVGTLRQYVEEDLQLLDKIRPDLVVGDFRLSLAIAAELRSVRCMSVTNIYWSPFAQQSYPLPDIPLAKLAGNWLGQRLFRAARPFAFAYHAMPLNRVRKGYGLAPLGHDLRKSYTHGDYTLYADIPGLVKTDNLPDNHRFLGPIQWSPAVSKPAWWNDLPDAKRIVYATLGSSGRHQMLGPVLEAMANLPVTVMAATAGGAAPQSVPKNAFVSEFLPGTAAARRAALVIGNGGSPSCYQALAEGKPVLGLASNLDQHLNMQAVGHAGAGCVLRAGTATTETIRAAVTRMLGEPQYSEAAQRLATEIAQFDASDRFRSLVSEVLHETPEARPVVIPVT